MTRIYTEGFEMGDSLLLDYRSNTAYGVNGSYQRTGNYCLLTKGNTHRIYLPQSVSEGYFRACWMIHSFSGYFRLKSGGTTCVAIRIEPTQVQIYINDSFKTTLAIPNLFENYNVNEMYINMDTVNGQFIFKRNGVVLYEFDGNMGATSVNTIETWDQGAGTYFDDFAVNTAEGSVDNSWCGDGRIIAIRPNANGDLSQLMGSDGNQVDNYALVDERPYDGDGTYVWGDTVDLTDLYNFANISLPANSIITRIWPVARAKDPDAGAIALPIKVGTTQVDGPSIDLTSGYTNTKGEELVTNPDTGATWEEEDINSLQAGFKLKS